MVTSRSSVISAKAAAARGGLRGRRLGADEPRRPVHGRLYRPSNLTVLVFDDGRHLTTGGQVTHTARGTDLAKVGIAVGVRSCRTVRDEASLVGAFATAGAEPGPHLLIAVCDEPESRPSAAGMPVPYTNVEQVRAGILAS